jgi:iron(III) transport system permease protein
VIWTLPAILTGLLASLPLVYIFLRATEGGWRVYWAMVWGPFMVQLVGRTLWLVLGVVCLSFTIALPMAWLVARTDLPGRRIWALLGALPLVIPSYVAAFSLVAVLGPRGYVQGWLEPLGIERLPEFAYGYSGALLALALFVYPYIYLPVVSQLRGLDPALEESARALGASRWRVFYTVLLPQLRLPLAGGALLTALYTLSDFGAVSITRFNTFTLAIYNAYQSLFDLSRAAAPATVLVLFSLLLISAETWLVRRQRPHRGRPSRPPETVALGAWRWPAMAAMGTLACLNVGLPLGMVTFWGIRGLLHGRQLSAVWEAALGSLSASLLAAVGAILLALPISVWSVRYRNRLSRLVERLTFAGYALPGLVIALALVYFATRYARPIYQSLFLLVLAYIIRFLPQAVASCRSAIAAVAPSVEEAGRSLGRSPLQVLTTVTVPLVFPGLSAGAGLVFLTAMKELPATLILRPIGFETLATEIWSFASEAIYSSASIPSLLLLGVTAPVMYLLLIRPALGERTEQ